MDTTPLQKARLRPLDTIEELGALSMHLREALDSSESPFLSNTIECANDATQAIDNAITELRRTRSIISNWTVAAEIDPLDLAISETAEG